MKRIQILLCVLLLSLTVGKGETVDNTLDTLRRAVDVTNTALQSRITVVNRADTFVRAITSDPAFAGSLFAAIQKEDRVAIQNLLQQKIGAGTITIKSLEGDFFFEFTHSTREGGFVFCLAGPRSGKKCSNGKNFQYDDLPPG